MGISTMQLPTGTSYRLQVSSAGQNHGSLHAMHGQFYNGISSWMRFLASTPLKGSSGRRKSREMPICCSPDNRSGQQFVDTHQTFDDVDEEKEDDICPVECVREFETDEEFLRILDKLKKDGSLVVVDFYRTSCGSCKYIEQGFSKLCKGSGNKEDAVVFLKHNVINEYEEQSEVAEQLKIRSVPLFHFYKAGVLVDTFATRDKQRVLAAILKYTSTGSNSLQDAV